MLIRPTLSFKLIASVSLLVISLAVILSSFFVDRQKTIIENELRKQGISLTKNLAYNSEYGLLLRDREKLDTLVQGVIKNEDVAYVAVCDQNSRIISYAANSTLWIDFLYGLRNPHSSFNQYSCRGKEVYDIIVPVVTIRAINKGEGLIFDSRIGQTRQENIGFARIGILLENKEKMIKAIQTVTFLISLLVVIGGVLWTVILTRRITKPIEQLVKATTRVAEGDLSCCVNGKTKHDEIGELIAAFNIMTGKLAESAREIEGYTKDLEQRVAERTSELMEANEQLKKLDELKSNFISVASHELRTPLTSIYAFCDLLLDDDDVNTRKEFLGIMKGEIQRLTRLINDILDLSKIEAGKTTWHIRDVSMIEVAKAAIESMKGYIAQQGICLKVDIPVQLLTVSADYDRLLQVMVNLLSNALKFVQQGGRIGINIRETAAGANIPLEVIVAVSDTGPGIPPEKLSMVFERFCQVENVPTEVKGTGLGLTICKEIIEHLGGRIWVESEVGKGTTFFFGLPVRRV